jgi:hypothetical protein
VRRGELAERPTPWFVLGIAWAVVFQVSAAVAMWPGWRRLNETRAIGSLQTIATAESIFRETDKYEDVDYATLAQLSQAQLIDAALGSGTKDGYLFAAAPSTSTSEFLWFAVANPQRPGITGERYFCTNHAAVIFYTTSGSFALNTTDCCLPTSAVSASK